MHFYFLGAAPVAYGQQQQNPMNMMHYPIQVQNVKNVPQLQQQVQVPQQQPLQFQEKIPFVYMGDIVRICPSAPTTDSSSSTTAPTAGLCYSTMVPQVPVQEIDNWNLYDAFGINAAGK